MLPYRCKISGDDETLVLESGRVAGGLAESCGTLAFRFIDGMNYFRLAGGSMGDDIRACMERQIPQE
jgi:hypothetical protein